MLADGVVVHGSHTFVNGGNVPPGAARLMAERPKALYDAGASTFSHGPAAPAELVGPVADTQIAKAHKIAIECMANLDQLPPKGATLVLGPLQLRNGSGSPLSIIAFIP